MGIKSDELSKKSAQLFIDEHLEQTDYRDDRVRTRDLYSQYLESTKYSVGRKIFNRMLESKGYMLSKSNGNVLTAYYIKSNWI